MAESGPSAPDLLAEKKGHCMKKYAKRLKEYEKIEFDSKAIIEGMSRLKGARRKPTSVALEEELLKELKEAANKRGVPYQVLMRLLIADGLKRIKDAA
jgi:predicted DNA binding CopG/RHH family protein